jgi:hypothetical protein
LHAVSIRRIDAAMIDRPPASRTRYGSRNPERVTNELWNLALQHGWSGSRLREHLGAGLLDGGLRDFSRSLYRDAWPGPFWSWQRYGRTSTELPDGRVIHVAGEHEDHYDVDFCIYTDVVVEHEDRRREFFCYPADVFPPTDFHSATLVGDAIILIGSLGYRDLRRPGETQVLRLDCATLRIARLTTKGDVPGWISRHKAKLAAQNRILVSDGNIWTASGLEHNPAAFALDLTTLSWRRAVK